MDRREPTVVTSAIVVVISAALVGVALVGVAHWAPDLSLGLFLAGALAAISTIFTALTLLHTRGAHKFDRARQLARQADELYVAASSQLGSDRPAVRLAGLYAFDRLGDERPSFRHTVAEVWCAYLRMPTQWVDPSGDASASLARELEVRATAQRLLLSHLGVDSARWPEVVNINLTGARLQEFDAVGVSVTGAATFSRATFEGATCFDDARFASDASFSDTKFYGDSSFVGAIFDGQTDYRRSQHDGPASFDNVTFAGDAHFVGAVFRSKASFDNALFGRALFGDGEAAASFDDDATFAGAQFARDAKFDGTRFGGSAVFAAVPRRSAPAFEQAMLQHHRASRDRERHDHEWREHRSIEERFKKSARFHEEASFEGIAVSGAADFSAVAFDRGADFSIADFGSGARFQHAMFSAGSSFDWACFAACSWWTGATFRHYTGFVKACFHDDATFDGATFEGSTSFMGAVFTGDARPSHVAGGAATRMSVAGARFTGELRWADREHRKATATELTALPAWPQSAIATSEELQVLHLQRRTRRSSRRAQ